MYCVTSDGRAFHSCLVLIREIKDPGPVLIPYPLENKPLVDMVQTG